MITLTFDFWPAAYCNDKSNTKSQLDRTVSELEGKGEEKVEGQGIKSQGIIF